METIILGRSRAYLIGINQYSTLPHLVSPVNDAIELARILREVHGYQSVDLISETEATLSKMLHLLAERLPREVQPGDRLLIYFAGHGLALRGSDGPTGYIAPQDGVGNDVTTLIPMQTLYQSIASLPCHHLLLILDCCFAGAFRWASMTPLRGGFSSGPLYKEQYERYLRRAAWQVLTSSAADQVASDIAFGTDTRGSTPHSPFAQQLYAALTGLAPVSPPPGDGIITANRLYSFLRDKLEISTEAGVRLQTPGLWPLPRDNNGEYIFVAPGRDVNPQPAPPLDPGQNPYRGLQPFEKEHKDLFFGRDAFTDALTIQAVAQPLTIVLGASGTGKSSLVRAGLTPRLEELGWTVLGPVRPGLNPLQALESIAGLNTVGTTLRERVGAWRDAHPTTRVLLIVDQLEEVLTLCRDSREQGNFLRELADALGGESGLHVVCTLRTEFEPQFTGPDGPLAALSPLWKPFLLRGMTQDELRLAIVRPATVRALDFFPVSLVDDLINEVIQMPGALPLLSFALSELYLRYLEHVRQDDELGRERALNSQDYLELGRVAGALQQRANREYQSLDAAGQATMKRLMLRMVSLDGGERTRRRVPLAELEYDDPAENDRVALVLTRLEAAHLIVRDRDVAGEPVVEPAHDALLNCWGQLWRWSSEDQETLLLQRALEDDATNWAQSGRPPGALWDGDPRLALLEPVDSRKGRLQRMAGWIRSALLPAGQQMVDWLNRRERQFVRASRARRQRNQRVAVGVGAGLVLLTVVALVAANVARANELQAQRQTRRVAAQALAADSSLKLSVDPELSILLATQAISVTRSVGEPVLPQAVGALHQALLESHVRRTIALGNGAPSGVAWSPDGQAFAIAVGPFVQIWDSAHLQRTIKLRPHSGLIESIMWSPDGSRILTSATTDSTVNISDPTNGDSLSSLKTNTKGIFQASWSPDGQDILITSIDHQLTIWDAQTRQLTATLPGTVASAAWRPDGKVVAFVNTDGKAGLWDRASKQETMVQPSPQLVALNQQLAAGQFDPLEPENRALYPAYVVWSPSGDALAFVDGRDFVTVADLVGSHIQQIGANTNLILDAEWSPDGRTLLTASADNTARVWDVASNRQVAALRGHSSGVVRAAWRGDGRYILTISEDQTAKIWDTHSEEGPDFPLSGGIVEGLACSPDGRFIVTTATDGVLRIWDSGSGQQLHASTPVQGTLWSPTWNPEGSKIATFGDDGMLRIWDSTAQPIGSGWQMEKPNVGLRRVSWSPDGQFLLSTSQNDTVTIVDVLSGKARSMPSPHLATLDAQWSPDGSRIITAGADTFTKTAKIWLATDFSQVGALNGHTNIITRALWSPDGLAILTSSLDGTARVWNPVNGALRTTFAGHGGAPIQDAAWRPRDARLVATAGKDGTVQVWDPNSGAVQFAVAMPGNGVENVVWSPDGLRLFAAGEDTAIHQYRVDIEGLIELAQTRVTRPLTPEERIVYQVMGP